MKNRGIIMGTIVSINIGNFGFLSSKNSFGDLLICFSKNELHIEEIFDGEQTHTKRYYSSTVGNIKKRLDVLGITLTAAKDVFEKQKAEYLNFLREYHEDEAEPYANEFTFENWSVAVKKYAVLLAEDIFSNDECNYINLEKEQSKLHSLAEKIVLDTLLFPMTESFWGMDQGTYYSEWEVFRVLLEAFDEKRTVYLDYTELFESGWCEAIPEVEIDAFPKIIVLTEGKFDTYVIEEAMKLLYPEMQKFYTFMDFTAANVQGSANFLTHYLKAFIGAKIESKIIALYDNDTAGIAEMTSLESTTVPSNVKIMHLPDLDLCKCYPTIGPTNNELADINGRACSIELFFGKDILQVNNHFIPIMWTGYNSRINKYQGEILHKGEIQKKFEAKLKEATLYGVLDKSNWSELDMLLNKLFSAFTSSDNKRVD